MNYIVTSDETRWNVHVLLIMLGASRRRNPNAEYFLRCVHYTINIVLTKNRVLSE